MSQMKKTLPMKKYGLGFYDAALLFAGTVLFAGCLGAKLVTGHYGFLIPTAAYTYSYGDFFFDAALSALLGWIVLVLSERIVWVRQSPRRRIAVFLFAAMVSLYCGPPSPLLFGNTWTPAEIAMTFFIAQMDIVLPVVVLLGVIRAVVLQRTLKRMPVSD